MFGLILFMSTSALAADFTIEMSGKRPGEVFASASATCPDHSLLASGTDAGANRDADRASRLAVNGGNAGDNVGSVQGDENKSHNHTQNPHQHEEVTAHPNNTGGGPYPFGMAGVAWNYNTTGFYTNPTTATNNASGGSESRPKKHQCYLLHPILTLSKNID